MLAITPVMSKLDNPAGEEAVNESVVETSLVDRSSYVTFLLYVLANKGIK